MSAFMLLANCPVEELADYAAENDSSVATATEMDTDNAVTVYKGGTLAFNEIQSNWYSTSKSPSSSNMNAYSIVSGYEVSESSITSEPVLVTDEILIRAVYYSYGAPGYKNLQTDMD